MPALTKRPNVAMMYGRIMVERLDPEVISKGGIHIAESSQYERFEAIVLAIGPGSFADFDSDGCPRYEPMPVKVGDRVLFSKYTGCEWTDSETRKKYLILLVDDVLMVIN